MDKIYEAYQTEAYKIRKGRNAPHFKRIKELDEPYKSLALQRAKDGGVKTKTPLEDLDLHDAFGWRETPEGFNFWDKVNKGGKPRIK